MTNTLRVSISTKAYAHKPTKDETRKIRFESREITVDEFMRLIQEGYAYTSLFKNNWRKGDNYICSSTLTFDIDHADVDMDEYVSRLSVKPTFAYTSSRNGLKNYGYGYRLVYVLAEDICTIEEYKLLSTSLASQLSLTFVDKRSFKGDQMWYGSKDCKFIVTNERLQNGLIQCKRNVIAMQSPFLKKQKGSLTTKETKSASQTINVNIEHYVVSCTFQKDYEEMGFGEFLEKYRSVCINKEKTDIDLNESDCIVVYPSDYYEIRRPWKRINGSEEKIKDGEGRRRKLFLNGVIRRKISSNMKFEDVLYCVVYEFYYHMVNNGNKITKKELYEIASNVMKCDISKYEDLGKPRYKSFVNPLYCLANGLTPKQVLGLARNKKQYIGEFFDLNLTVKENVAIMNKMGLEISERTVKSWMKENGITKYKKADGKL